MNQRLSEIKRILKIELPENPIKKSGAVFLWGPRQTGKTTLLGQQFPNALSFDLLDSDLATDLTLRPKLLREKILANERNKVIVIDEIQKVPELLDEVHWLLENTNKKIILCGSSARKLKRQAHNLLGGRAIEYFLFPLVTHELKNFDLDRALSCGCLPIHYLSKNPKKLMKAYLNNYIKEEIIDEALTRNIPSFARFLASVSFTHGSLINYANIARDVGVSSSTIRNYYQILIDTLVGYELEPWRKAKNRRLIETAKFYMFDVGVARYLMPPVQETIPGTDSYGNIFEHFLINEIKAYLSYNDSDLPLAFWRTSSGFEVDLILGDMDVALEFKSTNSLKTDHLKGITALRDEYNVKRSIVVSRDETHRKTEDGIECMHWKRFVTQLWNNEILKS